MSSSVPARENLHFLCHSRQLHSRMAPRRPECESTWCWERTSQGDGAANGHVSVRISSGPHSGWISKALAAGTSSISRLSRSLSGLASSSCGGNRKRTSALDKTARPSNRQFRTLTRDLGRYASGMRAKRTRSTGSCLRFAVRPAPSPAMVARACGRPAAWPCGSRTAWPSGFPRKSVGFGRIVGTSSIAPEP